MSLTIASPVSRLPLFLFFICSLGMGCTEERPVEPVSLDFPTDPFALENIRNIQERHVSYVHFPDSLMELYTQNAVVILPGGEPIQGRDSLAQYISSQLGIAGGELEIHSRRSQVSGSLAYDSGSFVHQFGEDMETRIFRGRYLAVFSAADNDTWGITALMLSLDQDRENKVNE